jgi:hypothetical protein
MLPFALAASAVSLKLIEDCAITSGASVQIDEFDIPFERCQITNFSNIEFATEHSTLVSYAAKFRTLSLDHSLKLTVGNVMSRWILRHLDIHSATVVLNLSPQTRSIDGNVRINRSPGGRLFMSGLSGRGCSTSCA